MFIHCHRLGLWINRQWSKSVGNSGQTHYYCKVSPVQSSIWTCGSPHLLLFYTFQAALVADLVLGAPYLDIIQENVFSVPMKRKWLPNYLFHQKHLVLLLISKFLLVLLKTKTIGKRRKGIKGVSDWFPAKIIVVIVS